MAIPVARSNGVRSACDRCYKLKERCERVSPKFSCERCERLDQVCLTVRPVLPVGRRSRRTRPVQQLPKRAVDSMQSVHSIDTWLPGVPSLSPEEKELLMVLLGDSKTLMYPVISPRFQDAEQESFAGPLPAAFPLLKDAYLAYAGVLKSLHPGHATVTEEASRLRHTTAAMVALRSISITSTKDAEICLTLGFALALSVYGAIGKGVSEISHYCLSMTRPFIEDTTVSAEMEPRISVLALLEIMECIVYRRKPTLRIQPQASRTVDRHLGLCVPLLSYFHDLCVISHSLADSTHDFHGGSLQRQLEEIQSHVQKWQPSQPKGFLQQFSTVEIVQLLAQARVYRLAALLMSHRLRYAFGHEDAQADIWSREVMMELELARQISDHPVRFVTLPFIIAAVEIRDPAEREKVIQNVDQYVDQLTPVVQKATRTFFARVWSERDTLTNFRWFDSIHKPCVVLDSIGDTFPGHLFGV